ncbi:hypothetical protein [Mycobacterium florentinum]|uniref:hypothetical protein n=1 Tax=Mycobacterium florentinum TaxID=292462 RepID=UPI00138D78BE|nr:hypothetical protein [Mycobacterium florentinum]BBX82100.1 hypothetical protein MFLOJ_58870 [Mycobacterium florentinum]
MTLGLLDQHLETSLSPPAGGTRSGKYAVQILPYDDGARPCAEQLFAPSDSMIAWVLGKDPIVQLGNEIQIQRSPQRTFAIG